MIPSLFNKKRSVAVAGVLFILLFWGYEHFLGNNDFENLTIQKNLPVQSDPRQDQDKRHTTPPPSSRFQGHHWLDAFIQSHAEEIGKVNSNPVQTRAQLKEMALSLSTADLHSLDKVFRDLSKDGDQRALALYLLSESENQKSLELLEGIVMDPPHFPHQLDEHQAIQEQAFLSLAIEGIENNPHQAHVQETLKRILSQTKETWIKDLSTRALLSNQGMVPKIKEQSTEFFKELLINPPTK